MKLTRNIVVYSSILLLYSLLMIAASLFYSKTAQLQFLARHFHQNTLIFYSYVTLLGEWPGILLFGFLVFLKERSSAYPFSVACLLTAIVINILKHLVFDTVARPRLFAQNNHIQLPSMASSLMHYSFPSGHTAIAVCMCLCICMLYQQRWIPYWMGLLAVLVALSRIFLFAHFAIDTAVGALLGLGLTWLGIYAYEKTRSYYKPSINK